jgi:ribonuclease D
MLDTAVFMRLLEQPKRSLQVLVHTYCNVVLEKNLQRSDWRIRPLDEEQLKYARSDTHYLLHCCDELCRLIEKQNNLDLLDVYDNCKTICLRVSLISLISNFHICRSLNSHDLTQTVLFCC